MPKFFAYLWAAAFDLTPEQRRGSVRGAAWVGALLVFVVLTGAVWVAGHVVPAESAAWEAVLLARIALVRLGLAVPLLVIGAAAAVTIYQVLENSMLGGRIMHSEGGPHVGKRVTILSTLFISCILGLLLGVLR